jgi:UDP-N-acetylmuramoyl-L-alanyl-D-glutamate--2,6-diaminopimelate ligase
VPLVELLTVVNTVAVLGDPSYVAVRDIAFDSRSVRPGALFCCLTGEHSDGHEFAAAAHRAGAVAFVCEHSLREVGPAVQLIVTPGTARAAMARVAAFFFGNPAAEMHTVGVTGTNGKTTTTYLLRSIFERHGWQAGVIGTIDGARTTPESPELQRTLRAQVGAGVTASALEVSSHALVQHRVDGIVFDVAVFTNLSQDHLDYHETMEAYFQAKATLFTPDHARSAAVNADDPYGARLLGRPPIPMVGFSLSDVRDLEVGLDASTFRLGGRKVRLGLGGEFNVRNALGAAVAARALDISAGEIVDGLEAARPVPGRFEVIGRGNVTAVVDYAHTPAGLEEVLRAARRVSATGAAPAAVGRVLVVFGCGGDRDRAKRPAMGAVASTLADFTVLTTDNPRSEDPAAIISEILAGVVAGSSCRVEPDRRRAIALALREARAGDVVVVAGKGHETTQEIGGRLVPFDDREVVRAELSRIAGDGAPAADSEADAPASAAPASAAWSDAVLGSAASADGGAETPPPASEPRTPPDDSVTA